MLLRFLDHGLRLRRSNINLESDIQFKAVTVCLTSKANNSLIRKECFQTDIRRNKIRITRTKTKSKAIGAWTIGEVISIDAHRGFAEPSAMLQNIGDVLIGIIPSQ